MQCWKRHKTNSRQTDRSPGVESEAQARRQGNCGNILAQHAHRVARSNNCLRMKIYCRVGNFSPAAFGLGPENATKAVFRSFFSNDVCVNPDVYARRNSLTHHSPNIHEADADSKLYLWSYKSPVFTRAAPGVQTVCCKVRIEQQSFLHS